MCGLQGISTALGNLGNPMQGNISPPAASEVILREVGKDAEEPGAHLVPIPTGSKLSVAPDQGPLDQVRGFVLRAWP